MILICAKVKGTLAALAEAILTALPLHEQLIERHIARRKHTKVTVQGHDIFIFVEGQGSAYGYGLLAYAAEPLADPALAQQHQHLFFDHTGTHELAVQIYEIFVRKAFPVKVHECVFVCKSNKPRQKREDFMDGWELGWFCIAMTLAGASWRGTQIAF